MVLNKYAFKCSLLLVTAAIVTNGTFAQAANTGNKATDNDGMFRRINQEVLANSAAYENLRDASKTIGHRLTGSENGKKAEQYTFDLLKSYGYNSVRFQPFEVESWSRGTVKLQLTDPIAK